MGMLGRLHSLFIVSSITAFSLNALDLDDQASLKTPIENLSLPNQDGSLLNMELRPPQEEPMPMKDSKDESPEMVALPLRRTTVIAVGAFNKSDDEDSETKKLDLADSPTEEPKKSKARSLPLEDFDDLMSGDTETEDENDSNTKNDIAAKLSSPKSDKDDKSKSISKTLEQLEDRLISKHAGDQPDGVDSRILESIHAKLESFEARIKAIIEES